MMLRVRGWGVTWILAVAAFLMLSAMPETVRAQGDAAAMQQGDKAASAGKWEEALVAYDAAHKAKPTAQSSRKRANALYKLNRTVDAYEAYEALLREHGSRLARTDKDLALKRRDELRRKTGTLKINVSETSAQISVDGKVIGTSPLTAPVRTTLGKHLVAIEKPGFERFTKEVEVSGSGSMSVDANLQVTRGGTVSVTIQGGAEVLTVIIDDQEVGPSPYTGPLSVGSHKVSARSQTLSTATVTIDIQMGSTTGVELVTRRAGGTLTVRIDGGKGDIFVDGEKVGSDSFEGEVAEGEHTLVVKRDGYEDFEAKFTMVSGQVRGESVVLRKATSGDGSTGQYDEGAWTFNGVYGGLQLVGMFAPGGAGTTMDNSCDVLGATSCDGGSPMGGGLGFYVGYAFDPVGLEFLGLGSAGTFSPSVNFDGVQGSDINPLVSSPARDEAYTIVRAGGGGAIRLRLLYPIDRFRITGAIGAGMVYRKLLMVRDGTTPDGYTSTFKADTIDYLSGVLSVELAGQVRLGGTTSLVVGGNLWLEHAGDGAATQASSNERFVKEGSPPLPHATPAYNLASGSQLFIGPFLGVHFGP